MSNVVPFKKPSLKEKHRGKSLCKSGFHKWEVDNTRPFDVKQGSLVTHYLCRRCGATKTEKK